VALDGLATKSSGLASALRPRDEVAVPGFTDVTLASIGRRAEVAKSTVYLRWPSVLDLLAEALIQVVDFGSTPDTGSLRPDLVALAKQVLTVSMVTPMLELHMYFWAMGARAPAMYRKFHEYDMALGVKRGRKVFDHAKERGKIRTDLDQKLLRVRLWAHSLCALSYRRRTSRRTIVRSMPSWNSS
jgi:AcrR family transcriptional regulator